VFTNFILGNDGFLCGGGAFCSQIIIISYERVLITWEAGLPDFEKETVVLCTSSSL